MIRIGLCNGGRRNHRYGSREQHQAETSAHDQARIARTACKLRQSRRRVVGRVAAHLSALRRFRTMPATAGRRRTRGSNVKRQGKMRLGAFFNPTGHHVASWRHPDAQADAGINFRHYVALAQTAERAKFDLVFLADNVCMRRAHIEATSRSAQYIADFEPLTLLSALAPMTERIGLVATASTSYNEPYHVARKFASLDHISGGRAGWNLVTSGMQEEAQNFGREKHYEHDERYDRAREFAQIVKALWDSWDDDAFVRDKEAGLFFRPDGFHVLDHRGPHFSVRGPLNVPRSPQGHPIIVQAGTSEAGKQVSAEFAEVIFSAPLTIDRSEEHTSELQSLRHLVC